MRKPRHRNSTRDREVAELKTLRNLAQELEAHVITLSRGELSKSQSRGTSESAWRALSERQAHARKEAERTNRKLNERVQNNADWIQRLWELLCEKRLEAEASELRKMATLQQRADDDFLMQQLKHKGQMAVPELPRVFAKHGVQLLYDDMQEDRWFNTKTGDLESSLVCVRRVPFDVHSTSAMFWTALTRPEAYLASASNGFKRNAKAVEQTPIQCFLKAQYGVQMLNETTTVNLHAVVQRSGTTELQTDQLVHQSSAQSASPGASMFVWQSSFALANSSARHSDTMWVTIVRSASHRLESVVAVVCQSHIGLEPGPNAASLQAANMQVVEGCISSIFSRAENMLLDEHLRCTLEENRFGEASIDL